MLPVNASPEIIIIITLISAVGLVMSMAVMGIAYLRVRNAKDALDESERRYRAVVEDQTELICRFKPDGTLVFVNDAFSRFFNRQPGEFADTVFVPPMDADEQKLVRKHLRSLTTVQPIATMTNRIYLHSGESRWIRWNNRGIFDTKGKIHEYQAVGTDVTEVRIAEEKLRKYHENLEDLVHTRTQELMNANAMLQQEVAERTHAEHQLAAEKERLAVTLRSIGDGVITTDTRGRVLLLNKVAEELTGFRHEQAFLRPLSEIFRVVDEQSRTPIAPPESGRIRDISLPVRTTRGILITEGKPERLVEQSAAGITDHENKTIGVVIVFRDMTERQKLEQELIRTQNLESLGLLAGGIAHDFNNILTAVFGNVMLAKLTQEMTSTSYERLQEAEQSIVRAKELTHQLLTFSKGGSPVKETADISGLVVDTTTFMLRGSHTRCEFSISPGIWPVDVDVGQISQVINNIVINADHAMPDGGVIQVAMENQEVGAETPLPLEAGNYVRITIADEGTGIPKENLDRIFDPYFTTKAGGSGLGLSTARSIVRRHSGCMSIESEVGSGTTVHIYLPASTRKIVPAAAPEPAEPLQGEGRILVMDDEDAIREIARALLEHLGYHVDLARDGEEAVARYREALGSNDPYRLVIMDLTIPGGMGGKEAVGLLHDIDPEIQAIVSSGYSNDPVMANFTAFGFSGILAKPYSVTEMAKVIRQVLQVKQS
jgi:two-component system, cell cycle sensor histidine kinase and response regulator CckA